MSPVYIGLRSLLLKFYIIGSLVFIDGDSATMLDCDAQEVTGPVCPRNCGSSTVNGNFYDEGASKVSKVPVNITSDWNGPGLTPPQKFTTDLLYSGLTQNMTDRIATVRCLRNDDLPLMCRVAAQGKSAQWYGLIGQHYSLMLLHYSLLLTIVGYLKKLR